MAEIRTADASDGSIKVQPPPTPMPKSNSGNDSEGSESKPRSKPRKGAVTSKTAEVNSRGIPKQNWDNPDGDPNARKHIGESPNGEGNEFD